MIRVDLGRTKLIRPGLAARVDLVRLLCLPIFIMLLDQSSGSPLEFQLLALVYFQLEPVLNNCNDIESDKSKLD